jgi:hypothetical protein
MRAEWSDCRRAAEGVTSRRLKSPPRNPTNHVERSLAQIRPALAQRLDFCRPMQRLRHPRLKISLEIVIPGLAGKLGADVTLDHPAKADMAPQSDQQQLEMRHQ